MPGGRGARRIGTTRTSRHVQQLHGDHGQAKRTEYATKLSQIQQDDTPILVPFFITQLRTQKKTVFGIQGPGNFYCIMSEAFKTA